ncbi:MAG: dTMP kinase [Treponema sp.]|jgi:dTMP kinase|nr:dTMP kinase [Treponema sp.]
MMILKNFAVFEGGDGSGTTTQLGLLRNRFASPAVSGLPPLYATWEPTDGPIGGLLRSALKGEIPLKRETLATLFAADRNEHVYASGGIVERSTRGELVISDRYVLSSLVYQGIDCGEELVRRLNERFPLPELLFFFDIDGEQAVTRMEGRRVKEIYEYLDFQIQVRERYRALLPWYAREGVRVEIIDASQEPQAVAEEIWRALRNMPIVKGAGNAT